MTRRGMVLPGFEQLESRQFLAGIDLSYTAEPPPPAPLELEETVVVLTEDLVADPADGGTFSMLAMPVSLDVADPGLSASESDVSQRSGLPDATAAASQTSPRDVPISDAHLMDAAILAMDMEMPASGVPVSTRKRGSSASAHRGMMFQGVSMAESAGAMRHVPQSAPMGLMTLGGMSHRRRRTMEPLEIEVVREPYHAARAQTHDPLEPRLAPELSPDLDVPLDIAPDPEWETLPDLGDLPSTSFLRIPARAMMVDRASGPLEFNIVLCSHESIGAVASPELVVEPTEGATSLLGWVIEGICRLVQWSMTIV